jgi:hypothetical protein
MSRSAATGPQLPEKSDDAYLNSLEGSNLKLWQALENLTDTLLFLSTIGCLGDGAILLVRSYDVGLQMSDAVLKRVVQFFVPAMLTLIVSAIVNKVAASRWRQIASRALARQKEHDSIVVAVRDAVRFARTVRMPKATV